MIWYWEYESGYGLLIKIILIKRDNEKVAHMTFYVFSTVIAAFLITV